MHVFWWILPMNPGPNHCEILRSGSASPLIRGELGGREGERWEGWKGEFCAVINFPLGGLKALDSCSWLSYLWWSSNLASENTHCLLDIHSFIASYSFLSCSLSISVFLTFSEHIVAKQWCSCLSSQIRFIYSRCDLNLDHKMTVWFLSRW